MVINDIFVNEKMQTHRMHGKLVILIYLHLPNKDSSHVGKDTSLPWHPSWAKKVDKKPWICFCW